MRKFHTYAGISQKLSRGLAELKLNTFTELLLERKIRGMIKKNGTCRILEIGTGNGLALVELCGKYSDVICIGLNKHRSHGACAKKDLFELAKKQKISLQGNCSIIIADATKLPLKDNSVNIVVSQVSLVHVKDKLKALTEISRVMRSGAVAYLDLDSWQLKKHKPKGILPAVYKDLISTLGTDVMPRIMLEKNGDYVALKNQFSELNNFTIKILSRVINDKKLHNPNIKQVIHITKRGKGKILLPFKRDLAMSNKLTNLPITDHNPASYGVVDYYKYKN